MGLLVVALPAATLGLGGHAPTRANLDADLARLLLFMAALKGAFALCAFGLALWRLGHPSAPWRTVIYVTGPGLMAAGVLGLILHAAGLAALALHTGLFALLAAALTDPAFFPDRRRTAQG